MLWKPHGILLGKPAVEIFAEHQSAHPAIKKRFQRDSVKRIGPHFGLSNLESQSF
jgi:hypothetical protein